MHHKSWMSASLYAFVEVYWILVWVRPGTGHAESEMTMSLMQGPVAIGGKLENRLKLPRKTKLITTLGRMTCKTRGGRENATAGQAELKIRLTQDQQNMVRARF